MRFKSHFIDTEDGKFHYKIPDEPPSNKPICIFLHGASKKSQHTEFWKPIIPIIENLCFPVLTDRFGHGESIGNEGLVSNDKALSDLINEIKKKYDRDTIFIVGRSAGTIFAIRQFNLDQNVIAGLGLIAPASLKSYARKLEGFDKKLTILWDVQDPVVNFDNYSLIKQLNIDHTLYTIGENENATKSIERGQISKTHAPELGAPNLFEEFLKDLIA